MLTLERIEELRRLASGYYEDLHLDETVPCRISREEMIELLDVAENVDAAMDVLLRVWTYLRPIHHVHLPDGSTLNASMVWDILAKYKAAVLAALGKKGEPDGSD